MADTPKHSVSVAGIVVYDQNGVLVIQRRDNGFWEPPGGVLEFEESPEDGTKCEVLEETGICVEVEQLSGIYKNMERGVLALVLRCAAVCGEPTASAKTSAVRWVDLAEIDVLMDPAYSARVRDCFEEQVAVRAHNGRDLVS